MSLQEKLANMLFGRDFSSDIVCRDFSLFKYFLVERSLPKKRWQMSHQGVCLVAISFQITVCVLPPHSLEPSWAH